MLRLAHVSLLGLGTALGAMSSRAGAQIQYVVENSQTRMVFVSSAAYGFVPKSITRKADEGTYPFSTFTFAATHLWEVTTWTGTGTTKRVWAPLASAIGSTSASLVSFPGGRRLELRWLAVHPPAGANPLDRLDVLLTATLLDPTPALPEPGVTLEITVTPRVPTTMSIHSVVWPRLSIDPMHAIAGDRTTERGTDPPKVGNLYDNPIETMAGASHEQGRFSPGNWSHQLFTYYDSVLERMLYLSTRDGSGEIKAISFFSDGNRMQFQHRAFGVAPLTQGAPHTSRYSVEVMMIKGDWFDAAKRYRAWAKTQPFTSHGVIGSPANTQFSALARTAGMFDHVSVCQFVACVPAPQPPPPFPDPTECVLHGFPIVTEALANWHHPAVGVPAMIARIGNYTDVSALQCIFQTPDPGDPAPGLVPTAIACRAQQNYLSGLVQPLDWSTTAPGYDAALPNAIVDENGQRVVGQGILHGALMCPGTVFWLNQFAGVLDEVRNECFLPSLYCDVWSGFPAPVCYAPDHQHPAGDPSVFATGQVDEALLLRNQARAQDPDFFLTTENVNELTLRVTELEFGQLRDAYNARVHPVPMFQAIYNPFVYTTYFVGYDLQLGRANCEAAYETHIFYQAMNYAFGNLPHADESSLDLVGPIVGSDPTSQIDFPVIEFIGKLARSYAGVRKFILEGEMERLNVVDVEKQTICVKATCPPPPQQIPCTQLSWPVEDLQPVVFGVLRHSLVDNEWAIVLVNWKSTAKPITFRIPPSDAGGGGSTVTLVPICMPGIACDPAPIPVSPLGYQTTISVGPRTIQAYRVVVTP